MKTTKSDIYYNLHKHCLSVRQRGIVVAHLDSVALRNVEFKVSEAGRQRVLKEKRKNVHATVRGEIQEWDHRYEAMDGIEITYNPYKYSSFVVKSTGSPVKGAEHVAIQGRRVIAWGLRL